MNVTVKRKGTTVNRVIIKTVQATVIDLAFLLWLLVLVVYVALPWLFKIAERAKTIVDTQTTLIAALAENPLVAPPISAASALQTEFTLVFFTFIGLILLMVCTLFCSAVKYRLIMKQHFDVKKYLFAQVFFLSAVLLMIIVIWFIYRSIIYSFLGIIVVPAILVFGFICVLIGIVIRWRILENKRIVTLPWLFFSVVSVGTLLVLLISLHNPVLFSISLSFAIVFGNALKVTLVK